LCTFCLVAHERFACVQSTDALGHPLHPYEEVGGRPVSFRVRICLPEDVCGSW
jgi:hypothetical protein